MCVEWVHGEWESGVVSGYEQYKPNHIYKQYEHQIMLLFCKYTLVCTWNPQLVTSIINFT